MFIPVQSLGIYLPSGFIMMSSLLQKRGRKETRNNLAVRFPRDVNS